MLGYSINDQEFYNPLAAFAWASKNAPHSFPKFVCHDDVFSKYDWTRDPQLNWQQLLNVRATMLRQKYDRLILAFSGGTDSFTAYRVFQDLGLHLDEIIVSYSHDSVGNAPKQVPKWLIDNHKDSKTKITTWYRQDQTMLSEYARSDWYLANQGSLRRFELALPGSQVQEYLQENYGNERWALITGHEKPTVFFKDGRWWATHLDGMFYPSMGWKNLEKFYVTPDLPELHIKQHHLLLNHIKKTKFSIKDGWNSRRDLGKSSVQDYYWYASACGRQIDLLWGMSFDQKTYLDRTRVRSSEQVFATDLVRTLEPLLEDLSSRQHRLAKLYLDGWRDLESDSTLRDYMTRQGLLTDPKQAIANYHNIWSKFYLLEVQA